MEAAEEGKWVGGQVSRASWVFLGAWKAIGVIEVPIELKHCPSAATPKEIGRVPAGFQGRTAEGQAEGEILAGWVNILPQIVCGPDRAMCGFSKQATGPGGQGDRETDDLLRPQGFGSLLRSWHGRCRTQTLDSVYWSSDHRTIWGIGDERRPKG